MTTQFILLKVTTHKEDENLAEYIANRAWMIDTVQDVTVITPLLELPKPDSEEHLPGGVCLDYHSDAQIRQIQIDAYAEGRRDEAEAQQESK